MTRKMRIFIILISAAIATTVLFIAPIDREPLAEKEFYSSMMKSLDTMKIERHEPANSLVAGWNRENIMPYFPVPMAGYKPRSRYKQIHDSLYANAIVIDNGSARVALVSFDLLITPPLLEERLIHSVAKQIPEIDFVYLSSIHTHNGIGGWDNSLAGQLISGRYHEDALEYLEAKALSCIQKASERLNPSTLAYFAADASRFVENRLDTAFAEDGDIRGIEIASNNGEKAVLCVFSAHATNIPPKIREISADYPGELNKALVEEHYDFAMFMAGAVGSHRLSGITERSFERTKKAGEELSKLVVNRRKVDVVEKEPSILFKSIPLNLGDPQLRISKNFRLREWVFHAVFSSFQAHIKYLQIGNLAFMGMPCDFSGEILVNDEIYDLAESMDKRLIVTSFNGDYIGYITEDCHYDTVKKQETREMNWVGPNYGNYFSEIVKKLLLHPIDAKATHLTIQAKTKRAGSVK